MAADRLGRGCDSQALFFTLTAPLSTSGKVACQVRIVWLLTWRGHSFRRLVGQILFLVPVHFGFKRELLQYVCRSSWQPAPERNTWSLWRISSATNISLRSLKIKIALSSSIQLSTHRAENGWTYLNGTYKKQTVSATTLTSLREMMRHLASRDEWSAKQAVCGPNYWQIFEERSRWALAMVY